MSSPPRTRRPRWIAIGFTVILLLAGATAWLTREGSAPPPNHAVHDPRLARLGVLMYVPAGTPRALVVFFGNDIGFWRPHRELAADLAGDGYAVAGVDVRQLFGSLPARGAVRDSACARAIADLVARSRRELSVQSVPVVIGGHSLGAELALWAGAHATLPHLAGVLALAPGARSHLQISASDLLQREPEGPESFALADVMRLLAGRGIAVAIVRGEHDRLGAADSALLANGGVHARRFGIALAGHSLRRLTLARPVVEEALRWMLVGAPAEGGRASRSLSPP